MSENLFTSVQQLIQKGVPMEKVRQTLLDSGWSASQTDAVIEGLTLSPSRLSTEPQSNFGVVNIIKIVFGLVSLFLLFRQYMVFFLPVCLWIILSPIYFRRYDQFGNEIGKLLFDKDYLGAVVLGESRHLDSLNSFAKLNLAVAYYYSGRLDEAKIVINSVHPSILVEKEIRQEIEDWKNKIFSS